MFPTDRFCQPTIFARRKTRTAARDYCNTDVGRVRRFNYRLEYESVNRVVFDSVRSSYNYVEYRPRVFPTIESSHIYEIIVGVR